MAEFHRIADRDEIEQEASAWIARLNAEDVTDADRASFEAWRSACPRNARAYEDLSATWRQFAERGELVRAVTTAQAFDASTQDAVRAAIATDTKQSTTSDPKHKARRIFMNAAAAIILACAVGITWWLAMPTSRTLFQTAVGEHATIELPDGSFLELNSNSLARVEFSDRSRIIQLERGEAYFRVSHDTKRPFWVVARGSWVRAVGTAFNVHIHDAGVRITVSEGLVKVATTAPSNYAAPTDQSLTRVSVSVLKAGQELDVHGSATEIRALAPVELTRAEAWRTGILHFEPQPLHAVVAELSRYTSLEIVIDDEELRALEVGGAFESSPQGANALLSTLQDGFGLHVRREGRKVYIRKGL